MISVIVPNFNDPRIDRTLNSVFKQNSKEYELIVIEGCENNNLTQPIYLKYSDKIKVIHEADRGIFDALNKGISESKGDLILLLGSDDYIESYDAFNTILDYFETNTHIDGFCLGAYIVNSNSKVIRTWVPKKVSSLRIRWGIMPHHFSLVLKRDIYSRVGMFDVKAVDIAVDTIWMLKLAKLKSLNIKTIRNLKVCMEIGGLSTKSVRSVLTAMLIITRESAKLGYWNFMFIPIIKAGSKLFQYPIFDTFRRINSYES